MADLYKIFYEYFKINCRFYANHCQFWALFCRSSQWSPVDNVKYLCRYSLVSEFPKIFNSLPNETYSKTGVLVLLALGFLMPSLAYIPKAVLAAVIITSVVFMVELSEVKHLWKSRSKF